MRGDTVHNIYPIVLPKVAIVMLYTLKEYIYKFTSPNVCAYSIV